MAPQARPPMPGPFVQPNFLAVMESIHTSFPISKRELLDHVGDNTVILQGRNVSLHDLIKDIPDDHFESEAELLDALSVEYGAPADEDAEPTLLPSAQLERAHIRLGEDEPPPETIPHERRPRE